MARPETTPLDRAGAPPSATRPPKAMEVVPMGAVAAPRSMTPRPNTDDSSQALRSPSRSRCSGHEPPAGTASGVTRAVA